jgi:hypothetical protein
VCSERKLGPGRWCEGVYVADGEALRVEASLAATEQSLSGDLTPTHSLRGTGLAQPVDGTAPAMKVQIEVLVGCGGEVNVPPSEPR